MPVFWKLYPDIAPQVDASFDSVSTIEQLEEIVSEFVKSNVQLFKNGFHTSKDVDIIRTLSELTCAMMKVAPANENISRLAIPILTEAFYTHGIERKMVSQKIGRVGAIVPKIVQTTINMWEDSRPPIVVDSVNASVDDSVDETTALVTAPPESVVATATSPKVTQLEVSPLAKEPTVTPKTAQLETSSPSTNITTAAPLEVSIPTSTTATKEQVISATSSSEISAFTPVSFLPPDGSSDPFKPPTEKKVEEILPKKK